ncbi:hypothetical protein BaRGS_00028750 [Batillaria attramentaria]|uniref:Uncharacterized protein n=1 Tax=Batillaria attramentaria TaxID=370345 RepID=A0ABD0JZ53_9CAEN
MYAQASRHVYSQFPICHSKRKREDKEIFDKKIHMTHCPVVWLWSEVQDRRTVVATLPWCKAASQPTTEHLCATYREASTTTDKEARSIHASICSFSILPGRCMHGMARQQRLISPVTPRW